MGVVIGMEKRGKYSRLELASLVESIHVPIMEELGYTKAAEELRCVVAQLRMDQKLLDRDLEFLKILVREARGEVSIGSG